MCVYSLYRFMPHVIYIHNNNNLDWFSALEIQIMVGLKYVDTLSTITLLPSSPLTREVQWPLSNGNQPHPPKVSCGDAASHRRALCFFWPALHPDDKGYVIITVRWYCSHQYGPTGMPASQMDTTPSSPHQGRMLEHKNLKSSIFKGMQSKMHCNLSRE